MSHFAIAGLQLDLPIAGNLDLVLKKIRVTALRYPWVQMVVLSELAICGPVTGTATALPSPTEDTLASLAKELGLWIVSGSLYEMHEGKVYNTASVINPDGEVVTRYRKMYPFYPYEAGVAEGQEICVFDVPGVGRFGLSICYDMWFPETTRAMVTQGAEVILHPTLTSTADRDVEHAMARAAAAQNQCYVIDINGAGEQAYGCSMIIGPEGDVIHAARRAEEIIAVEIDLGRVRRTRERGLMGLGQPLKSFRDAGHRFPQEGMANRTAYLDSLGPLEMPKRGG
ncbi:carbon-nitrogen hydrolase family protein [Gimibacter soli]|uniref:Carbon-nitrogen hydrolase family protein n=1 Tax=Gimibacter soli TaxID=3024400 RepID=A0AAE9XQB3_9PROT|nr:carbon-nitrogen hydrolase family protein [Gimibacter soli]WCL55313.1 carbon-nitrogen hydrolase family protein [Gimibacter soli]